VVVLTPEQMPEVWRQCVGIAVRKLWSRRLTQLSVSLDPQVEVIEGDILQLGCGLSAADRRRLGGCSVVVHAAASVCFTSPVRESLQHNYHVRV
jgi:thioester reductase-like protein